MIASIPLPPISEVTFIIAVVIAVIAAAWVAWILGYEAGMRKGEKIMADQLRRNLNLPPRVQR